MTGIDSREPKPRAKPRPKIRIWVHLRDDPTDPWIFEAERQWVTTDAGAVHIEFDDYYHHLRRCLIYPLDLVERVELSQRRDDD